MIPLYEPHLRPSHKRAAIRQIESGWIGPGKMTERFAAMLGEMHGRHCTVTNSGTSALLLALLALDLPHGATIACPDYGLPACQNAARLLGYKVKLIDVDPVTGCMDRRALLRYASDEASPCDAVVIVGHNGHTDDALFTACRKYDIGPLIEDSAVALGCPPAGTAGDVSILSFSVPKIITTGQGGAVLTSNSKYAERLSQLVDQGGGNWRKDRIHTAIGGNFRMPDVLSAMGVAQLESLPGTLMKRERLWNWYREDMEIAQDVQPSGWVVTVRGWDKEQADSIIEAVTKAGYEARRLYQPVHRNDPFKRPDEEFPGACELYDRLVYLPSSLTLTRRQVKEITRAVARGRS